MQLSIVTGIDSDDASDDVDEHVDDADGERDVTGDEHLDIVERLRAVGDDTADVEAKAARSALGPAHRRGQIWELTRLV